MKRLYKLGLLAQDTSSGLKSLSTIADEPKYSTLQLPYLTDYQVPAGKQFFITQLQLVSGIAGGLIVMCYADTGVQQSVSPGENNVVIWRSIVLQEANKIYPVELFFPVPSGKYIAIRATGGRGYAFVSGVEI